MHIPDGFLDTKTLVSTAAVSLGVVAYGIKKANEKLGEKQVPLLGLTAAFIFAAQMLNFPVAGGTSGHFLGAVLAAVLLGPWMACLVMTVVLAIQCLGFADGGLTALGANIFNMGVIGSVVCYYIFVGIKKVLPKNRAAFLSSIAFVSWLSVLLSSSVCAVELWISGTSPLTVALPAMAGIHVLIGVGEAIITVAVVSLVLAARPDLVTTYDFGASVVGGANHGIS
jgi:cobalt/nickel transport system permease protein